MTTRTLAVGLLGALLTAAPLLAQTPIGQPPADDAQAGTVLDRNLRSVDFGVRLSDVDGDEARFNRYRDMRTGAVLDGFRWTSENANRYWRLEADNVGYRDQRFGASFEQFGRFKGWFEYNQIPYEQDYSTQTPYTVNNVTTVTVDDALQAAIQAGQATLNPAVNNFALPFELRAKRDITKVGGQFQLNRSTDINFALVSTGRSGHQPWGASFGMASTQEIPAPIEQRNTEIAANLEWANKKATFKAGYDGSLFNSDAESLTFDNPLRLTNATNATSIGRVARWPSSTMHTISATGTVALPAKSRLIGYVGQSAMTSDADILDWTINPAITQPPLERRAVDAEADVTTVLLRFNSRPVRWAWFNASYRSYDMNNKTPPFHYDQKVSYDTTLVNTPGESSHPYSFNRETLEIDGSFTPWRNGAFKVGYVREDIDRTNRIYETTVEDSYRFGYDWTSNRWVTVRAGFLTQERRGEGFDTAVAGRVQRAARHASRRHQQPGPRRGAGGRDLPADRHASRSTSTDRSGVDDRPDGDYGLRSQDFSTIGFGVDYAPSDAFNMGAVLHLRDVLLARDQPHGQPAAGPDVLRPAPRLE